MRRHRAAGTFTGMSAVRSEEGLGGEAGREGARERGEGRGGRGSWTGRGRGSPADPLGETCVVVLLSGTGWEQERGDAGDGCVQGDGEGGRLMSALATHVGA